LEREKGKPCRSWVKEAVRGSLFTGLKDPNEKGKAKPLIVRLPKERRRKERVEGCPETTHRGGVV